MQLDIIQETEVNITSAMTDQSDSLAAEKKNHKRSSDLLARVQKKLAAQPGDLTLSLTALQPPTYAITVQSDSSTTPAVWLISSNETSQLTDKICNWHLMTALVFHYHQGPMKEGRW